MSTETPTIFHETVLKYEIDQLDHRLPILKDVIRGVDLNHHSEEVRKVAGLYLRAMENHKAALVLLMRHLHDVSVE